MKPTISIATITNSKRRYFLDNYFRSLVDLKPNEVCILDTTSNEKKAKEFQGWLKIKAKKYNLPLKLEHSRWSDNYSTDRNISMDMCTSDWIFFLDSDEMVSRELARDLRKKLALMSPKTLVVRVGIFNLIDDKYCLKSTWLENKRTSPKHHGRIVRKGSGKWAGRRHEQFIYPGRKSIPWNSSNHPKKDLFGYFLIHLWLYKDNPMRRNDWSHWDYKYIVEKPNEKISKAKWAEMTQKIVCRRRWNVIDIPDTITWVPINWKMLKDYAK